MADTQGQLNGKVLIVTGATSGIGRAAALLFAREGARLVVNGRRVPDLSRLADEVAAGGGEAVAVAGSVADEAVAARLVAAAEEAFGGLDGAFNNAGIVGTLAPAADIPLAAWRETLEVNLTGAFLCARYQLPALLARGGGALVFASSFVGHEMGFPGMTAYGASKAGLVGLARGIAAEYGPQGVRANALLPGGTDTPMGREVADSEEKQAFVAGLHALKRTARPAEIAAAAAFLLSDAASFVTGAAFVADGGNSITKT